PGDAALVQYTSGSTGAPKGVVVTHANLAANIHALCTELRLVPEDRLVSWLPLYHDMGLVGGLLAPACAAVQNHLLPTLHFLTRPAAWLHALTHVRATLTVAPNFAYSLVAR